MLEVKKSEDESQVREEERGEEVRRETCVNFRAGGVDENKHE